MTETNVRKDLPDHFDATYDTHAVHNIVSNGFIEVSGNKAKWIGESEFKFGNLMMKMMSLFMPLCPFP